MIQIFISFYVRARVRIRDVNVVDASLRTINATAEKKTVFFSASADRCK